MRVCCAMWLGCAKAPATTIGRAVPIVLAPPSHDAGPPSRASIAPPEGVNPEHFAILADICALAIAKGGIEGLAFGCRSNPPFDEPGKLPDGEVREAGEFRDVCDLRDVYRGAFSSDGKEQAILGLMPCGDERLNDISPGHVVLVERHQGKWHVVATHKETNVHGCHLAKRGGRAFLVCHDSLGAFSEGALHWYFTLDFSKRPEERLRVFAKLYDTPPTRCEAADKLREEGVTLLKFPKEAEQYGDRNGDGLEDLIVHVDRAYAAPSPALAKKLAVRCRGKGEVQWVEPGDVVEEGRRFVLAFEGTETGMQPTKETRILLSEWTKAIPPFWRDLK